MPNWFQQLIGNPQLLVFLAVIAFSVLGTVAKKVQEEKAKREMLRRRQQMELEALRTGRPTGATVAVPAPRQAPAQAAQQSAQKQRLDEIAARRKAQLEELRRRQQAGGGAATAQRPGPQAPPTRPVPARPTASAPARTSAPKPPQTRPQQRPTARPPQSREQRPSGPRGSLPVAAPIPAPAHAALAAFPGAPRTPDGQQDMARVAHLRGLSRAELRRAFVLSEVLAPPVSQREGHA